LGSKDVALDGRHTPSLYSRFLSSLLAQHTSTSRGALDRFQLSEDDLRVQTSSQFTDGGLLTPTSYFSWPDIEFGTQQSENGGSWAEFGDFIQGGADANMDLSLSHFLRTVTQNFPGETRGEDAAVHGGWDRWGWESQVPWPSSPGLWSQRNGISLE
jgi:transcriptional regulatory protein LEU3